MLAIRTEALTKHYAVGFWRKRPYVALDGLSLEVAPGEIFGFLGPNGAGKTTTLKLLMELVYPTSGCAEILGRPVGDLDVKRRLGYLPENPSFYDHLTAEELLDYFANLFGYAPAERRRRASSLLDAAGIGAERRLPLRRFSKGMLQRVGLAQALVNDPEIVFFDEPMSGLDPLGRRDVREMIRRLGEQGRTVFFSSHVLSDAETLCTRVAILNAGRLVAAGRLADMLAFRARGWDLVVTGLSVEELRPLLPPTAHTRAIAERHVSIELPLDERPEPLVARLASGGGQVMSLNPVRQTLEEFFVEQVRSTPGAARSLD